MFDNENNEQDDFFAEDSSDFSQQDNMGSADFFNKEEEIHTAQTETHASLSYKTVGVVVAIILAVLALIILGLSNIHLVKKEPVQQVKQVEQEQQPAQDKDIEPTQPQVTQDEPKVSTSGNTLVEVPDSTYIDYSVKTIQSQGVVQSLSRYLQDGQVIYCINLDITMGKTSTEVKYYCGYNVFKQVKVGDIVTVDYQQVSDTCFSVCTISK